MKVFNWVHRRFLNANSCTSFDEENEREKGASSKVENEKHVLLEHDAHMVVEMLDHWKDGILSIGTLAINPLDEANIVMDDDDDDGNNNDDGDGNDNDDVMMNKYNNNYDIELADDDHDDDDDGDDDDGGEATPLMNNVEFFSHELEKVIIGANHEITEEGDNEGEEIKKRVTLAELFMEEDFDSQCPLKVLKEFNNKDDNYVIKDGINNINDNKKGIEMIIMKPNSLAKSGFSNAKKLLKKDLQPLKKFNKLMKRMMKKKIHPDMEAKMQKDMQVMPRCCLSNPINDHDNASNNEFASLLLIQDGTV